MKWDRMGPDSIIFDAWDTPRHEYMPACKPHAPLSTNKISVIPLVPR